ncbi:hypothetical protein DPQ22_03610 [Candidatus Tokpelaia sp.]|nr:hypothetical protein DPQ22_03610 [Candidatus Tokpelaia sp.]
MRSLGAVLMLCCGYGSRFGGCLRLARRRQEQAPRRGKGRRGSGRKPGVLGQIRQRAQTPEAEANAGGGRVPVVCGVW